MLDLEELEDGGAVVGDGDVADVVDEHLVEPHRSQAGLDDVGDGGGGQDVLRPHIRACLPLAGEAERCGDRAHGDGLRGERAGQIKVHVLCRTFKPKIWVEFL